MAGCKEEPSALLFHTGPTSHILEQYFCPNGGESMQLDGQAHVSVKNEYKS